jgi:PAS domain S-box-containing protein
MKDRSSQGLLPRPEPLAPTAALLAAIVESSDDAIVSKTLDGTILSWNGGAERLFGWSADEAIGRSIKILIPFDRHFEEDDILTRLRRGERVDHYETIRLTKDGRLINVSVTSSPVRDETGRIVGASKVARDITARKQAEADLKRAADQLLASDRAKTRFLATLAHELRNPLAPLSNALHVVRVSQEPMSERLDWAVGVIERQAKTLARVVDDLIDVSRINHDRLELRRERLELAAVLHSAAELSAPAIAAAGVELVTDLPSAMICLVGDPTRLAQAIANLLNNAAKFTDPGGRITIAATVEGNQAVVRVIDTGIGIPPDKLGTIFEMFAQIDSSLDRNQSGLGIGLTLVRRLIELHGGTVTADSRGPGTGSTFTIRLPIRAPVD